MKIKSMFPTAIDVIVLGLGLYFGIKYPTVGCLMLILLFLASFSSVHRTR